MVFTYWTITIFGIPFQGISANQISSKCSPSAAFLLIRNTPDIIFLQLQMHNKLCVWFRLFPFRSPLLGKSIFLSFPEGTKMFQFPSFLLLPYLFK